MSKILLDKLCRVSIQGEFISGDYETLEINQQNIKYFQKRSENNTEWLDELINQIEDMKKIFPNLINVTKRIKGIRKFCKRKWI